MKYIALLGGFIVLYAYFVLGYIFWANLFNVPNIPSFKSFFTIKWKKKKNNQNKKI